MFTPEMLESVKKVEATRAERLQTEPKRMSAEEKRYPSESVSSGL
jgi:succinate dehydrogenase / fumarate reductase flavoprotein subunit